MFRYTMRKTGLKPITDIHNCLCSNLRALSLTMICETRNRAKNAQEMSQYKGGKVSIFSLRCLVSRPVLFPHLGRPRHSQVFWGSFRVTRQPIVVIRLAPSCIMDKHERSCRLVIALAPRILWVLHHTQALKKVAPLTFHSFSPRKL